MKISCVIFMMAIWIGCFFSSFQVSAQHADSNIEALHREDNAQGIQGHVRRLRLLIDNGGRLAISADGRQIAFDRKGSDGYFDVWMMNADGSEQRCLTCHHFEISRNNGNPAFDPSGKFIIFTAENPYFPDLADRKKSQYLTSPGLGINNDLWLINLEDLSVIPLTHVKNRRGVSHPHFSPDGTKIVWSEIISPCFEKMGVWAIKLADFSYEGARPCLSHIQTLKPKGLQFYETHGFSPDGESILFSGVPRGGHYYDMEIYSLNIKTNSILRLTDNDEWDEHAHFTRDGRYIIWVSSAAIAQVKETGTFFDILKNPPRLDFWIMNADGSNKQRFSFFNGPEAVEYVDSPDGVEVGDFDIYPNGRRIMAEIRCYHKEIMAVVDLDRGY